MEMTEADCSDNQSHNQGTIGSLAPPLICHKTWRVKTTKLQDYTNFIGHHSIANIPSRLEACLKPSASIPGDGHLRSAHQILTGRNPTHSHSTKP
jgi:hypothetical protein